MMYKAFLIALIFLIAAMPAYSQESDTVETIKQIRRDERMLQPHNERQLRNMFMPQTGTFEVPEPREWYTPPFMGQKYLEIALAGYYKKHSRDEKSLLYRFINTVAPFIDNQFEFAIYKVYDLPIVDRNNPLLDPQLEHK